MPARSRAPSCAARAEAPIRTTRALADIVGARRARAARRRSIRRRARSRRCASSSTRSSTSWRRRSPPPSACSSPAAGWSWSSFHSLEDRIVKTFLAERGRRSGGSRHPPEAVQPAPTFRILTGRPVVAGRSGDRRQSARALGQAARRRAHRRAGRGDDLPAICCRACPSLADVCSGRRAMIRLLNICVIAALVARGGLCLQDQVRIRRGRPSGSPSCAPRSGASTTPSPRCARNGRSSTIPRASRNWRKRHLDAEADRGAPVRPARPSAGAAARPRAARRGRSDRRR